MGRAGGVRAGGLWSVDARDIGDDPTAGPPERCARRDGDGDGDGDGVLVLDNGEHVRDQAAQTVEGPPDDGGRLRFSDSHARHPSLANCLTWSTALLGERARNTLDLTSRAELAARFASRS